MSDVLVSLNHFCLSLYGVIAKENRDLNIFFSPMSIYTALAMVYAGSNNETAKQMKKVMGLSSEPSDEENYRWIEQVWSRFIKNSSVQLDLANKLWLQKDYQIKSNYQEILTKYFKVVVETEDFRTNVDDIRNKINSWVAGKTHDKIQNLLPDGSVSELTRLVLVNAIYFKGKWKSQFRENLTRKHKFFGKMTESKMVDMMFQESKFRFAAVKELDVKVISLPYEGSLLSMVVMLPNEIEGIGKLEADFNESKLQNAISSCLKAAPAKVEVWLPKFKFDLTLDLIEFLTKLGMKNLFDEGSCDLSGISERNDLFVSKAIHKAFVEVNEEGTEAAAATAMIMNVRCAMPIEEKYVFKADHPFLFFIYDERMQSVLFMGKMCDL